MRGVRQARWSAWLALTGRILEAEVDKVVPVDRAFDGHHGGGGHRVKVIAVVPLGDAVDVVAARFAHQHSLKDLVCNYKTCIRPQTIV